MKKECRKYIEWKRKNPHPKVKAARQYSDVVSEVDDVSESERYACFRASDTDYRNSWYVDSGATSHMCSDRKFFVELEQHKGQIVLADGQKLMTHGIGTGYLNCRCDNQCKRIKVTEVLYIPQLKGNFVC